MPWPQRAKTDAFDGLEWDNPDRPEARNLLTIYQCVTGGQLGMGVAPGGVGWSGGPPALGCPC